MSSNVAPSWPANTEFSKITPRLRAVFRELPRACGERACVLLAHLPCYLMEIYVLKDGRRRGPFLPFKLREFLEDKELKPSDSGWIEGMEAWAPLSSIEALTPWMPRDPTLPPPLPVPEAVDRHAVTAEVENVAGEEKSARRVRVWLRWLARTIDEMLWFMLVWLVALSGGWVGLWDFLWRNPLLLFAPGLAWIPVEAYLLHRFGTTPGKWLTGIRVCDDLGQLLTYPAALKRSALVLVIGNGMGLPIFGESNYSLLPMLQGTISLMLYMRSGSTLWDRAAQSYPTHARLSATGLTLVGLIVMAWMGLGMWISFTAPIPPDVPEERRAPIDEMRRQLDQIKLPSRTGPAGDVSSVSQTTSR